MQALRHHSYGDPVDVVVCDDILESLLESHHVRLRMIFAPINPADINMCEGKYLVNLLSHVFWGMKELVK